MATYSITDSSMLPDRNTLSAKMWHAESIASCTEILQTNAEHGISEDEVKKRLKFYGNNRITPKKGKPVWLRFVEQFQQPLVYILLIAGTVAAFLGETIDAAVIFAVVLINAIIGFIQESKAEKAIDALSRLIHFKVTVIRAGEKMRVNAEALVPGDLIQLEAGDRVPADIRLTYTNSLQIDESALTGESIPANKNADCIDKEKTLTDRVNIAYAGTLVTNGIGRGIVFQTGDDTETGLIAKMINQATDLSTPLTKKITQFSKLLLWVILLLALITFVIGIFRGQETLQTFMAAVAIAVACMSFFIQHLFLGFRGEKL
jgi:Ca2+-transporting ATPase